MVPPKLTSGPPLVSVPVPVIAYSDKLWLAIVGDIDAPAGGVDRDPERPLTGGRGPVRCQTTKLLIDGYCDTTCASPP